jgi:hypothetical protein
MAKDVRIKLNSASVRALLNAETVQRDLKDRAERIAAAAGPGMEVEESVGATRARAAVVTESFEAKAAEARTGALTRALGAGR